MRNFHRLRNVSLDRCTGAHLKSKAEFSHDVWNSETQLGRKGLESRQRQEI